MLTIGVLITQRIPSWTKPSGRRKGFSALHRHLHGDSGGMEIGGNRSQMCTINAVLTHPNVYVDDTPVQR